MLNYKRFIDSSIHVQLNFKLGTFKTGEFGLFTFYSLRQRKPDVRRTTTKTVTQQMLKQLHVRNHLGIKMEIAVRIYFLSSLVCYEFMGVHVCRDHYGMYSLCLSRLLDTQVYHCIRLKVVNQYLPMKEGQVVVRTIFLVL